MDFSEESLPAYEELFLYACPKFIAANPPPFEDVEALTAYMDSPPDEPAQRHLKLFLSDVKAQATVPTLRSFLKLYASLDARKLAGFLNDDEEAIVQQMMVLKQCSRRVGRVGTAAESGRGLLDGEMVTTSDLDFVIDEVGCRFNILVDFSLFNVARRTWCTLSKQPSGDAMRAGLSATQSMLSECWTASARAHFQVRVLRLQLPQVVPLLRLRWLRSRRKKLPGPAKLVLDDHVV